MQNPGVMEAFAPLERSGTALLTTFRRNGNGATTPVSVALQSGRAYFVTAADSAKARRLAHCDQVSLAPCTAGGTPLDEPVHGTARVIEGAARRRVRGVLRPTKPLFWSYLLYRMRGHSMNLYEVLPAAADPS